MENNHTTIQQQWLYKKLLKIIPDLPQHLEEETPTMECTVPGNRDLHFMYGHKESEGVHFITLEQSDKENGQKLLVTEMEVRISLLDQTATPTSYSNRYEDLRLEPEGMNELAPADGRDKEVYGLFKTWLKSLDHRGYRLGHNTETHSRKIHSDRNQSRNKSNHEIDR